MNSSPSWIGSYQCNYYKIRGNKSPTRCNRLFFYCKTYCSLNMFWAPLCPSSGAQDLYRRLLPMVLGALVYRSLVWCGAVGYVSGLWDAAASCIPDTQPTATVCINLELLTMGIMVPETC